MEMQSLQKAGGGVAFDTGAEILGPILRYSMLRMHGTLHFLGRAHDGVALFASRAGLRMRYLYEVFADCAGIQPFENSEYLWVSRLLAAKGIWTRDQAAATEVFASEFRHASEAQFVKAILGDESNEIEFDRRGRENLDLASFLSEDTDASRAVRRHLVSQSERYQEYISQTLNGRSAGIIVDSGWQGTTQKLLARGFPEKKWFGVYMGKSFFPTSDRSFADDMIGLIFESDQFDPRVPETSINVHRHFFETLFEPIGPSIERIDGVWDKWQFPGREILLGDKPQNNAYIDGIVSYFRSTPRLSSLSDAYKEFQDASRRLARLLAYPTKSEALALGFEYRSADFGRKLRVPVLLTPTPEGNQEQVEDRIKRALWPQAQIALEYSASLIVARQRQQLGIKVGPKELVAPAPTGVGGWELHEPQLTKPSVAIIMRTMDRMIFLERALDSVARQTFSDYLLVIVCDGGNIDEVYAAAWASAVDKRRVVIVDNIVNRGMEAASNIGIKAVESEFVVIHDDDDTWDPQFLRRSVSFLRQNKRYGGVITKTWYVSEEVGAQGIRVVDKKPYQDWVSNVQFMEMACENFFAPIAFVFRRSVWQKVGGYDENFPVLGDWDFNLRFLSASNIGVLPEFLANYHHRDQGSSGLYGNSVISGVAKHAEFNSIMRNKFVQGGEGAIANPSAAALVSMAHAVRDIRLRLEAQTRSTSPAHGASEQHLKERRFFERLADDRYVLGLAPEALKNHKLEAPLSDEDVETIFASLEFGQVPVPRDFDDRQYLFDYEDVAAVVGPGMLANGYEHFIRYGRKEGRKRASVCR